MQDKKVRALYRVGSIRVKTRHMQVKKVRALYMYRVGPIRVKSRHVHVRKVRAL